MLSPVDRPGVSESRLEKRAEAQLEDLYGNLVVQLGIVTEGLNRFWYQRNTGQTVTAVPAAGGASGDSLFSGHFDGVVEGTGAVFEPKFMLPQSFSEEGAAQKYIAQVQHNMWITNATTAALRWWQVGRTYHSARFDLPAYAAHGREKVLALR